jgi:uncharacterized protein involved in exopolysaccharide biosynthesis
MVLDNKNTSDEISLILFGKTILREKRLIVALTSIITSFSIIFALTSKPVWVGSFNIVVRDKNEKKTNDLLRNFKDAGNILNPKKNLTEQFILSSPSVLMPIYEYVKSYYETQNINTNKMNFNSWFKKELDVKFKLNTEILKVKYKNTDKKLILEVLNKISKKYQEYSKKDQEQSLDKSITFIEKQSEIMKKKSDLSMKVLNKFSIENGLGDIDGFVKLDKQRFFNNDLEKIQPNNIIMPTEQKDSGAGQRYQKQFALLERYEAQYLDFSSKLKGNSKVLKDLETKIENLKSSLKRPNKILIEFREKKFIASRDKYILEELSRNLQLLKLEKIRSLNPWEMISIPTIEDKPIFPKTKQLIAFSIFISFILSSLIALIKEKKSGIIYDYEIMLNKINCKFIDTLYSSYPELIKELLANNINLNYKGNTINKVGIVDLSTFDSKNFLKNLNDRKSLNFTLLNKEKIESFKENDIIIFLLEEGQLNNRDIIFINQIYSALKEKVFGWYLIDSRIKIN